MVVPLAIRQDLARLAAVLGATAERDPEPVQVRDLLLHREAPRRGPYSPPERRLDYQSRFPGWR